MLTAQAASSADVKVDTSRVGAHAFLKAMAVQGRSRQRTGASEWRVFRSIEHDATFVETFVVRSWGEHMRQHYTRLTGQDRLIEEAVERLIDGEAVSEHYLAARDVG